MQKMEKATAVISTIQTYLMIKHISSES